MNQDLPIDLERLNKIDPCEEDRLAAADLLVELRTRVATRATHAQSGGEDVAVSSLQRIFFLVRSILKKYPEAQRFQLVALSILDCLLRPHINRWSDWLKQGSLSSRDKCRTFRQELKELQPAIRRACLLLDKIHLEAKIDPDDLFMGIPMTGNEALPIRSRRAFGRVEAKIQGDFFQCEPVLAAEKAEILGKYENQDLDNVAGLALSGGGIRSATFALGVVKVLVERGIFKQFHYLSTVSGGGYLGTYLSSYLNDPDRRVEEVFDRDAATETAAVRHLRNNSKFLLAGGLWNQVRAIFMMVSGILTTLLSLIPVVVGLAILTNFAGKTGYWGEWFWWKNPTQSIEPFWDSPAFEAMKWCFVGTFLLQVIFRPLLSRFFTAVFQTNARFFMEKGSNWVSIVALLIGSLAGIPFLFRVFNSLIDGGKIGAGGVEQPAWLAALGSVLVPLISGPLAAKFREKKLLGPVLRVVFLVSGPLLLLCAYLLFSKYFLGLDVLPVSSLWLAFAVVIVVGLSMDLNALSPHHIYREKLRDCYLVGGRKNKVIFGSKRLLKLSNLGKGEAPYHLVNTAVNLPASKVKDLRGRRADFFLLSKSFCGSPTTGYVDTKNTFEKVDPNFDLASAMAVSGAAFSSNMGVKKLEHFRFFLTLLNVRLGYWIPNTLKKKCKFFEGMKLPSVLASMKDRFGTKPGVFSLYRELFGNMSEKNGFLNLSDGGHIENLAVYELLRRRAKFIVAVDGECDAEMYFDGLVKLIRYARIDLGAEIEMDPADLNKGDDGFSPTHSLLGRIIYADQSVGWFLYLKLSLTGDESPELLAYQREHPDFPHQTTMDQLYSERQFESYRWLGQHVGEELFRSEYLESKGGFFAAQSSNGQTDLASWFEALAMNVLPDNHPVFRSDPSNLEGMAVGISVSESPDFSEEEINLATIKISQMLIGVGAVLVFGHDWRDDGVMQAIAEFARNDRLINDRDDRPVIWNRYEKGRGREFEGELKKLSSLFDKDEVSGDLTSLREVITEKAEARICVGGKMRRRNEDDKGFTGSIPGILEEAYRAAKDDQVVLISGCCGGASAWMAQRLLGQDGGEAPDYEISDDEGGRFRGFHPSPDDLVDEIGRLIEEDEKRPQEIKDLQKRLWQTTKLDAALGVMEQILGLERIRMVGEKAKESGEDSQVNNTANQ